jgi:hypothetical protein
MLCRAGGTSSFIAYNSGLPQFGVITEPELAEVAIGDNANRRQLQGKHNVVCQCVSPYVVVSCFITSPVTASIVTVSASP